MIPKLKRKNIAVVFIKELTLSAVAATPPCLKRQKDTKEKGKQGKK